MYCTFCANDCRFSGAVYNVRDRLIQRLTSIRCQDLAMKSAAVASLRSAFALAHVHSISISFILRSGSAPPQQTQSIELFPEGR